VEDVLVALNSFPTWQIRHANREANKGAHGLAQRGIKHIIDTTWLEAYPNCICDIVLTKQLLCQ
jgi:hypothetical protein